eukprot:m.213357 g.213357  ORF g.213357 m.213357 type:complete len:340 (-) comp26535_c0_seq1:225-1244(-)
MHKYGLVMVDSRPLEPDLARADTNTLAAVLNYLYAQRHGYGFRYYHLALRDSVAQPRAHNLDTDAKAQHCQHAHFGWKRAAPWCKLLGLYDAASMTPTPTVTQTTAMTPSSPGGASDTSGAAASSLPGVTAATTLWAHKFLYLDSDAAVVNQSASIDDALASVTITPETARTHGVILSGSNYPWVTHKGTSGTLLITPSTVSRYILLHWWNSRDYNHMAFRHTFEQVAWEALWEWDHKQLGKQGLLGVVDWKAFRAAPSGPPPFLRHIGSDDGKQRRPFFMAQLKRHGVTNTSAFTQLVDDMLRRVVVRPNTSQLEAAISIPIDIPIDLKKRVSSAVNG